VAEIKRYVVGVLGDENYFAAQGMGYADFIEDIRVAVCAIADDNARTVDQGDDILNDRGIFPDIVSTRNVSMILRHRVHLI
jgi:hypothetical protein